MSVKQQLEQLYDKICATLTDYEQGERSEATDTEWLEDFYVLLVEVQSRIESIEE